MTSALSKKRKAEEEPQSMTRRCTFPTTPVKHGAFEIFLIAWADNDFDDEKFSREIEDLMALAQHLGARMGRAYWIDSHLTGREIGRDVQEAIEDFKEECLAVNAHEIIIYSGHGGKGDKGQLVMSGGGSESQSMEWTPRLLNAVLSGPMATLLLMDYYFSGLTFKGPAQPCKLIFAACAGTVGKEWTPGPGGDSFSSLLVLAGRAFEEPFTWQEWIAKTVELADELDCQVPVLESFGGNDQILFKPRPWVATEKKRFQERVYSMNDTLNDIWNQQGLNDDDFPTQGEMHQIASASPMLETCDSVGIYQALRKIRDDEIIRGIQASNPPTLLERLKRMKFGQFREEYC